MEVKDGDEEALKEDRWLRGLFIPPEMLEELGLEPGSEVEVVSEGGSIRVRSAESRPPDDLIEFAHSFDGYRHFGGLDAAIERTDAVRSRWEECGTLPGDVDDLRACLFCEYRRERFVEHDDVFSVWDRDGNLVHEADPDRVTPARRAQELYKRAVFDRIAQLLVERG